MSSFFPHHTNKAGIPSDRIEILGLRTSCIIGIYQRERLAKQPLKVDLALYTDTRRTGKTGSLQSTIDYAQVAAVLEYILENGRFRLLESAADAICRTVLAILQWQGTEAAAELSAFCIRLSKPTALLRGSVPTLHVFRKTAELAEQLKQHKHVTIAHEDKDSRISLVTLPGGHDLITHEEPSPGRELAVLALSKLHLVGIGDLPSLAAAVQLPHAPLTLKQNSAERGAFLLISRPLPKDNDAVGDMPYPTVAVKHYRHGRQA